MRGLLYYLFTEGLAGEKGLESAHADARVVASWDGHPGQLQPPLCGGGKRDFTAVVSRLNEPVALLGLSKEELRKIKPVYHLTIAAAKDAETGQMRDRFCPTSSGLTSLRSTWTASGWPSVVTTRGGAVGRGAPR